MYPGPSAYSCLAQLPGGDVGLLFEAGEKSPYEKIAFARFGLAWAGGKARPKTNTNIINKDE